MPLLRLFMIVLLITAVPVHGMAAFAPATRSCPMHADAQQAAKQLSPSELAAVHTEPGAGHSAHDCCKDDACARTDTNCKSCQVCKISSHAQLTSAVHGNFAMPHETHWSPCQSRLFGVRLASIWRPPALF
jgi:hypothetical protein